MLCSYGCKQKASYQLKNGKWCCCDSFNKCPRMREKNSLGLKNIPKNYPNPRGMLGKTSWNKGLTKETSEIIKKDSERQQEYYKTHDGSFKGKTHSLETKEKISKALVGNNHAKHQGNKKVFYKGIQMDSSWEVAVAKYLDDNNINWKYEEKRFPLSKKETYAPDFFIYDSNWIFEKLIEVKGYFRKNNKRKFEEFKLKYPEIKIELWQWKELRERKLIDSGGYLMASYTVGVAGVAVDHVSKDSGGSTPSLATNLERKVL